MTNRPGSARHSSPILPLLGVLLGLSSLACGDSPVTEPDVLAVCATTVRVTATAGTTPTFDWSPRCRVGGVLIEPIERGIGDRWSIRSDSNTIAPPLPYGVEPAGARTVAPPQPLEAGKDYRIVLEVRVSENASTFVAIDTVTT